MGYICNRENRWKKFQKRITVDSVTECWNWDKPIINGYGISSVYGIRTVAHRAVWIFLRGDIPEGLDLDHLCRNRACVNPDHLEPVTRSVNLMRGFEARGCKNGHEFNEKDFSIIDRGNGRIERRCKICHRARNRKSKNARRKSNSC